MVLINVYGVNRDESVGPDAATFDPERHAAATKGQERAWLPFGLGPRGCIGQHIALIEMAAVLPALARHGDPEIGGDPSGHPTFTLRVRGGLRGRLRRPSAAPVRAVSHPTRVDIGAGWPCTAGSGARAATRCTLVRLGAKAAEVVVMICASAIRLRVVIHGVFWMCFQNTRPPRSVLLRARAHRACDGSPRRSRRTRWGRSRELVSAAAVPAGSSAGAKQGMFVLSPLPPEKSPLVVNST